MVTETGLVANLGWEERRAKLALDQLVGSCLIIYCSWILDTFTICSPVKVYFLTL